MSSYSSKPAEIKKAKVIGIVSIWVECGKLEYSGREDNLVARRIVIRIPSL